MLRFLLAAFFALLPLSAEAFPLSYSRGAYPCRAQTWALPVSEIRMLCDGAIGCLRKSASGLCLIIYPRPGNGISPRLSRCIRVHEEAHARGANEWEAQRVCG